MSMQKRQRRDFKPRLALSLAAEYRSKDASGAAEVMVMDCVHRGLLFQEVTGELSFGHLTYQEYLAGRWLAEQNAIDDIWQLIDDPWWGKTLEFYAGIQGDVSALVVRASKRRRSIEIYHAISRLLEFAHLTPKRIVREYKIDHAGVISWSI